MPTAPHGPPPDWLRQYVASAPRATAVVTGPAYAVCAANPAFRALRARAVGAAGDDAPADTALDTGWPATDACLVPGADALRSVLDRVRRTGAPARGVVSGAGDDPGGLWEYTVWPAPDGPPDGVPDASPDASPGAASAAALVVELVPAGEAERAGLRQRELHERLLLSALREHDLAQDAEAARRVVEQRVAERTAELARANAALAAANAALAAEVAERGQLAAARDALRRQLAEAEEAERRRLARELHDQLGQELTAFRLGLEDAARLAAGHVPPDAPLLGRLAQLGALAARMTAGARALALQLRPPELDDVGLESALTSYAAEWTARYGVAADVAVTGLHRARALPPEVGSTLYRIAQEALTNVAKHAGATQVSVIVEKPDGEVRLLVEDNGRGFDVEATAERVRAARRLGLAGMRERAALVGGTVAIESSPGAGTTLYARLPVERPADGALGDGAPGAGAGPAGDA